MTPSEPFIEARPLLLSIAYRMLGSRAEAEDIVQDAFLRFNDADAAILQAPRAWLTKVVTNLCLDRIKAARTQRELYVGSWLPEPTPTNDLQLAVPADPQAISMAFLVLLESLTPLERASYLLAEVFDYNYAEIASFLGRDEAGCRQLARRARVHIEARRPRFAPSREAHERMLVGFAQACQAGDLPALERMLAADVVAWSDGGGKVTATLKPVRGANAVARLFTGLARKGAAGFDAEVTDINGAPAMVGRASGAARVVLTLETDGERIYAVRVVLNPDKLRYV